MKVNFLKFSRRSKKRLLFFSLGLQLECKRDCLEEFFKSEMCRYQPCAGAAPHETSIGCHL